VQFLSRLLVRWPIALACVLVLGASVLLPGLGSYGLWEPQERALADRVAPRPELAAKQAKDSAMTPGVPVPLDSTASCSRAVPKDAVARSLTNRAMVWGRDTFGASDTGRRLPLALLGLLTVLATAGLAMRIAGARAGVLAALVLLSMPLLVLQSRQLLSEIGTPAGGALVLYGLVALGEPSRKIPAWLTVLDQVVSALALAAGLLVGFLAGGALLGLLVPLGAYALANALGWRAVGGGARVAAAGGSGIARRLSRRWGVGRIDATPPHLLSWVLFLVGLSALVAGLLFLGPLTSLAERNTALALAAAVVPLSIAGAVPLARAGVDLVDAKALVATLAVIALVAILAYQVFSLIEPQPWVTPSQRQVLGKAIVPSLCYSPALGAIWRAEDDLRYSFDSAFEQIAYGTFPWGVLGPIAVFALMTAGDQRRRMLGGIALVWAAGAWIAVEVFQRKIGFTVYAGFPALALAIGVWFDALLGTVSTLSTGDAQPRWAPPAENVERVETVPRGAMMLVGLFALLAIIDLGKDLQSFPERATSLLVGSDQIAYPKPSRLLFVPTKIWWLALGAVVALGVSLALIAWRESPRAVRFRRFARQSSLVAIVGTVLFAAFLAYGWQPALSANLSSKQMFDSYMALSKPGDQLVVMGDMGDAVYDYAPTAKPELVTTRQQVVDAIGRSGRVFAIAPQTELCQLHREIGGKPYFVLDDRNTRSLLPSNKVDGTTDKDPLRTPIPHEPTAKNPITPKTTRAFQNHLELLGWSIPRAVNRGDKFTVTSYYKVLQPVGGNWRVLYHFDSGLRFNGDHEPINGRCQTATWQPGDYIVDTYTVSAGGGALSPGPYEVWTGFFTGAAPNWKNMPVSEAPAEMRDQADRVKITTITLQ